MANDMYMYNIIRVDVYMYSAYTCSMTMAWYPYLSV